MDKMAEFYRRWFAKKRAADCSAAEAASEELANEVISSWGVNNGTRMISLK